MAANKNIDGNGHPRPPVNRANGGWQEPQDDLKGIKSLTLF